MRLRFASGAGSGTAMAQRVAVITGGGGDLALAIIAELRQHDVQVLTPGREQLDVTNEQSVTAFFNSLDRVDLLINNAGARHDALCAAMTEREWNDVLAVNLTGAFLCSRAAAVLMLRQRSGHIVNIGSFSARAGTLGQANYAAAKAALIGLTTSMARELGRRNVRVNCVSPGFIQTKFVADMSAEVVEQTRQLHELGRFNTVEDAAKFIVFIDSLQHTSGQVFQLGSRIARWT
jgi:3-oxoacyl-[acyl-carrier protein] reductase